MSRLLAIAAIVLVPPLVLAGLVALDRTYGPAERSRDYVIRLDLPPAGGIIGLPRIEGPPDASRPLVVIDAGHGGRDPGAGSGALKEKAVTLAMARAVRDILVREGGIRVALTRDDDRFLVLEERSGIARRLNADLFVSIHADSAPDPAARGASAYTLSQKGSNQTAARIAARENTADLVNGVALSQTSDTVSAILVDLSQDETGLLSRDFARLALRETGSRVRLHDGNVQSAAFVVLKSPDLPSVLFESGYMSNTEDAALLASRSGREQIAGGLARAIRVYFARRSQQ